MESLTLLSQECELTQKMKGNMIDFCIYLPLSLTFYKKPSLNNFPSEILDNYLAYIFKVCRKPATESLPCDALSLYLRTMFHYLPAYQWF
jgi:hypothetical protein